MADIGLKAVMDMAGFTQGINKYNQMLGGASTNTDKKAGLMTKALANIGKTVKVASALAVGGLTAITGAMAVGLTATIKWAETLDNVGDVLGTTTEESAALAVAAQSIGGNVEALTSQMAILTRGLFDAKGEIGPTGLVLQNMGIAFQDANGAMLPTTEILQSVADKIASMPDGLEKTQLMMDLFGKSGKDMSDMMGILADGGMEAMNQKAKALGLSMGEEATAGAIALGRSMNDLKMMGQGLLVQLGTQLLPILQPIIEAFMKWAMEAMPKVIQGIGEVIKVGQEIWRFIDENFVPILKDVFNWFGAKIPAALGIAKTFYEEHLKGPLTSVVNFIATNLIPAFSTIKSWLETNIPNAIGTLKAIWETLKTKWQEFKDFLDKTFGPALDTLAEKIGTDQYDAAVKNKSAMDIVKEALNTTYKDAEGLVSIFDALAKWIGRHLPESIQSSKPGWEGFKDTLSKIYTIGHDELLGPDGALTLIYDFFKNKIAAPVWAVVDGPLAALIKALKDIYTWISNAIQKVKDLIAELDILGKIHIPNIFGSKGRIQIGLEGIAEALDVVYRRAGQVLSIFSGLTINPAIPGALTGFAGAIRGRFAAQYIDPLAQRKTELEERIAWLEELKKASQDPAEVAMYNQNIARAQKEYTEVTGELIKYKEQELALEKQLADLQFLQQQMDFIDFLRENELDIGDILGDLQLGLDLDLPAFMDAITAALAQLVAQMNAGLLNPAPPGPLEPPNSFTGGKGISGGGGMAIYNNQSVNINMNVALNNGMDVEAFKVLVLDTVSGAIR